MEHAKYWKQRKIDWVKSYTSTWNHPHRDLIVRELAKFRWNNLYELGCGGGANLLKIHNAFPGREMGGVDINEDGMKAVQDIARGLKRRWQLDTRDIRKGIFLGDKSSDVVLTDMSMIYLNRREMGNMLKEIKRVVRDRVIFVEFHHTSWLKRLKLKITTGYNAYNYKKLLAKHGFYDIIIKKFGTGDWPDGEPQKTFGNIIICKK